MFLSKIKSPFQLVLQEVVQGESGQDPKAKKAQGSGKEVQSQDSNQEEAHDQSRSKDASQEIS
jgi:hypothetical protein